MDKKLKTARPINEETIHEGRRQSTKKFMKEHVEDIARYLEGIVRDLRHRAELFADCVDGKDENTMPSTVASWMVNELVHLTPNFRLDTIARYGVDGDNARMNRYK